MKSLMYEMNTYDRWGPARPSSARPASEYVHDFFPLPVHKVFHLKMLCFADSFKMDVNCKPLKVCSNINQRLRTQSVRYEANGANASYF